MQLLDFRTVAAAGWNRLSTGSANRRIFGAAVLVGSLTLIVKAMAMIKESFVAAYYGTGNDYDAFIIAQLVPMTVISVISGSLNAALIPTYIEVRERENVGAAQRLYTTVLMLNALLLVGLTLVLVVTSHLWLPLIASGFDPEKLALTRSLFYWSLPIVIITGFSTTWGAVLNAGERFRTVALAPALHPIAILIILVLMGRSASIQVLLLGTLLGAALEAALVGVSLVRCGHPLLPRWHGVTPALRQVLGQYAACIAGAFLMSGVSLVDQTMASMLGPRSNSALSYGSKLVALVMTLGAASLGTAVLPQFSRLVALQDWKGLRHCLRMYSRLILAVTVPLTVVLLCCSSILIQLLYQRGAFSVEDTELVARVQSLYLLRLPFSITLVLVTRLLTAMKANLVLTMMSVGTFVLNGVLNYLFMLRYGVAGITLSTSACSVIVLTCLSIVLYRMLAARERSLVTVCSSPQPKSND